MPGPSRRKRQSTSLAVNLVKKGNLSTRKASAVCMQIKEEGINLPTPTQAGIYKATFKEIENMKIKLKEILKLDEWVLHFDGKIINKKERQVIVVKNSTKEYRLAVVTLENGRSNTIYCALKEVLNDYDLWGYVKMIISDTCNVNIGNKTGVVVQAQRDFIAQGYDAPQFIGCQHHILDRILKLTMDELLISNSSNPMISYKFMDELIQNYDSLVDSYEQNQDNLCYSENPGWRSDLKYLYELCQVFRFYLKEGVFPKINFKRLPVLHQARWNSRGILAILGFILIPRERDNLLRTCKFITGAWMDAWFSDQKFNEEIYQNLSASVINLNKAKACLEKHWVLEDSIIPGIQRSNIVAERAIKCMAEIDAKSASKLNQRFILTNKNL